MSDFHSAFELAVPTIHAMQFSLRFLLCATTLIALGVWLAMHFPYQAMFVAFNAAAMLFYFCLLRGAQLAFRRLARRRPLE